MSYATKQLISREVDLEKIKRTELKAGALNEKKSLPKKTVPNKVPEKSIVPNHLQRLQPKIVKPTSTVSVLFYILFTLFCSKRYCCLLKKKSHFKIRFLNRNILFDCSEIVFVLKTPFQRVGVFLFLKTNLHLIFHTYIL